MTAKTDRKRSLASALTYRSASTILLAMISYIVTGQWLDSLGVTVSFALLATALYYFNDRAWERTDWGRIDDRSLGPADSELPSISRQRAPHVASELIPLSREVLEEAS